MANIDKTVAKEQKFFYLIALSMVAILTIFGHVTVQYTLMDSLDDSHIINVAGRQRMLSQKLTKMALIASTKKDSIDYADFKASFRLWKKSYEGLKSGHLTLEKSYHVTNSRLIRKKFAELDKVYFPMEKSLRYFDQHKTAYYDEAIDVILKNEKQFLVQMNNIVFQYDLEASERVNRVRSFEYLILFLTLLTLIVEAFMIFMPLINYVSDVILKITDSEKELQETNQKLTETNIELKAAQEQLLKVGNEKYEILRKEDLVRSSALLEGQEEERKRLSRELHDGVGQMLTGIKLNAARLKGQEGDLKFRKAYEELHLLINETIESTRMASFNLMPPVLNDFGLVPALKILCEHTEKAAGIKIQINAPQKEVRMPQNIEINLYRIVQEALNNTVKHAQATSLSIDIETGKETVGMTIRDNGVGFKKEKQRKTRKSLIHNGLENMKTRTQLLNGSFKLYTGIGEGTTILIKLPLSAYPE